MQMQISNIWLFKKQRLEGLSFCKNSTLLSSTVILPRDRPLILVYVQSVVGIAENNIVEALTSKASPGTTISSYVTSSNRRRQPGRAESAVTDTNSRTNSYY